MFGIKAFCSFTISVFLFFAGTVPYSAAAVGKDASAAECAIKLVRYAKLKDYPTMTIAEAFEPSFDAVSWRASGNTVVFTGNIKESYYSVVANSAAFRDAPDSVHKAIIDKYTPVFAEGASSNHELRDFFEAWKNESSNLVVARDMLNYYAYHYCTRGTPVSVTFSKASNGVVSVKSFTCPNCLHPGLSNFLDMLYYPLDYGKNILNP